MQVISFNFFLFPLAYSAFSHYIVSMNKKERLTVEAIISETWQQTAKLHRICDRLLNHDSLMPSCIRLRGLANMISAECHEIKVKIK